MYAIAAMYFNGSKFHEQFLKRVTQGTILRNYFKIQQEVSEEKNFEEFLWIPHSEKSRRETQSVSKWAALPLTYWKHTDETSNIASDEDITENNYMLVMLRNLSVIIHWIFPQSFFLFLAQYLKIT